MTSQISIFSAVFVGGGFGAVARYWLSSLSRSLFPAASLPWGTLVVNVSGCLMAGFLVGLFFGQERQHPLHLLLLTGFCGGFTTFSTFSLETVELLQGGHMLLGAAYMLATLLSCLLGVYAGWWLSH